MNRNNLVVTVAVIALVVSGVAFLRGGPGIDGINGRDGVGATATLDGVDNPYVSINGVRTYNYNQTMSATSSVVCSLRNPFQATSTLLSYSVAVNTNGLDGKSEFMFLSTSTASAGTSTPAYVNAFDTGTAGGFTWSWQPSFASSTALQLGLDPVTGLFDATIGPNDYLTLKIATSTAGTFVSYLGGTCSGVLQKL